DGERFLLLSRKSPKLISTSPRSVTLASSSRTSSACSALSILLTEPSLNRIVGPSMLSTKAIVAAFPGWSTLTCVPTTTGKSRSVGSAGWIPIVERPVLKERPYLNLKPPILPGDERTALPEITSSKWAPACSVSFEVCCVPPPSSPSHSQPEPFKLASFFSSLWPPPTTPSLSTLV